MSEIFLKSNDLSLGYSNQIVIKGMNLNLFDEKNYQIIGKNGAGKTTLMNFIHQILMVQILSQKLID